MPSDDHFSSSIKSKSGHRSGYFATGTDHAIERPIVTNWGWLYGVNTVTRNYPIMHQFENLPESKSTVHPLHQKADPGEDVSFRE